MHQTHHTDSSLMSSLNLAKSPLLGIPALHSPFCIPGQPGMPVRRAFDRSSISCSVWNGRLIYSLREYRKFRRFSV